MVPFLEAKPSLNLHATHLFTSLSRSTSLTSEKNACVSTRDKNRPLVSVSHACWKHLTSYTTSTYLQ